MPALYPGVYSANDQLDDLVYGASDYAPPQQAMPTAGVAGGYSSMAPAPATTELAPAPAAQYPPSSPPPAGANYVAEPQAPAAGPDPFVQPATSGWEAQPQPWDSQTAPLAPANPAPYSGPNYLSGPQSGDLDTMPSQRAFGGSNLDQLEQQLRTTPNQPGAKYNLTTGHPGPALTELTNQPISTAPASYPPTSPRGEPDAVAGPQPRTGYGSPISPNQGQSAMYSPPSGAVGQTDMYSPPSGSAGQSDMYQQESTNWRSDMYSPESTNWRSDMYSPESGRVGQADMYSPSSGPVPSPASMYMPPSREIPPPYPISVDPNTAPEGVDYSGVAAPIIRNPYGGAADMTDQELINSWYGPGDQYASISNASTLSFDVARRNLQNAQTPPSVGSNYYDQWDGLQDFQDWRYGSQGGNLPGSGARTITGQNGEPYVVGLPSSATTGGAQPLTWADTIGGNVASARDAAGNWILDQVTPMSAGAAPAPQSGRQITPAYPPTDPTVTQLPSTGRPVQPANVPQITPSNMMGRSPNLDGTGGTNVDLIRASQQPGGLVGLGNSGQPEMPQSWYDAVDPTPLLEMQTNQPTAMDAIRPDIWGTMEQTQTTNSFLRNVDAATAEAARGGQVGGTSAGVAAAAGRPGTTPAPAKQPPAMWVLAPDGGLADVNDAGSAIAGLGDTGLPTLGVLNLEADGAITLNNTVVPKASLEAAAARGEKAVALSNEEFDAIVANGLIMNGDGSPVTPEQVEAWRSALVGTPMIAPAEWMPYVADGTEAPVTFTPEEQAAAVAATTSDSTWSGGNNYSSNRGGGGGYNRGGYSRGGGGGGGGYGGGGGSFPPTMPDGMEDFFGPDAFSNPIFDRMRGRMGMMGLRRRGRRRGRGMRMPGMPMMEMPGMPPGREMPSRDVNLTVPGPVVNDEMARALAMRDR